MASPFTLIGFDSATSLGVSVPTALSSPTLTLIGTSPAYPINSLAVFATNQVGPYDTYVSVYAGPSGSQQLIIPNAGHGNGNPLAFSERFYLGSVIPPNTDLWATSIYSGGSAGTINVSVGVQNIRLPFSVAPIQFLGNATPPGTLVTSGAANTMGSWVSLGSTTYASKIIKLHVAPANNSDSGVLYLGIGSAPSSPIFSLPFNGEASYAYQDTQDFYCELPPGTTLSVAYQSVGASVTLDCFLHCY